jgi:caa(3)-type oxidase subunit IV
MAHEHAAALHADIHDDAHHGAHPDSYYVKIWALLLVLLVISVLGPLLEHKVITLVTAFGIAIVKAFIVCAYFMHLSTEKSYVTYLLLIALFLMALMFSGISPDVLKMQGTNWRNTNEITLPPAVHHGGAAVHGNTAHGETAGAMTAPHHESAPAAPDTAGVMATPHHKSAAPAAPDTAAPVHN